MQHDLVGCIKDAREFNIHKSVNVIHHTDKHERQKLYDLNRWRKSICQNLISFQDKNSQQTVYRRNVTPNNKGHICQVHN